MHLQGFRSRVAIGPAGASTLTQTYWFAVKNWSVSDEAEGLDVSNTESIRGGTSADVLGPGTSLPNAADEALAFTGVGPSADKMVTPGQRQARIELGTATLMAYRNNPFKLPFRLRTQKYFQVRIYPNRGDLSVCHVFLFALATSVRHEGEVGGLQPVTVTLETDGAFALYIASPLPQPVLAAQAALIGP